MLSKSCEYAIRAVLYLSIHSNEHVKVDIRIIATELNIPKQFLNKILQKLARNNLVYSSRGNSGGFYIDSVIQKKPILAIVELIDGLDEFHKCSMGLEKCSHSKPCAFHKAFHKHRIEMLKLMKNTTIIEMSSDVKEGLAFLVN
ncbi:MAG: Rrf2 family transcriptional regulator [Bacteroidia bacterium]|nr:Rrf2 family transcriptional regulator [Bacteroidia bacterium]